MQLPEHFTEHAWEGDFPYLGQIPSLQGRKGAEGAETLLTTNARKTVRGGMLKVIFSG